jgi:predicted outer membrane repeat protein
MSLVRPSDTRSRSLALAALCGLALVLWGVVGSPLSASAASFDVTSTADDGSMGTLRWALSAAGSGDTIDFNLPGSGNTIALQSAITVPVGVDIVGPGSADLTITRANAGDYNLFQFIPTSADQDYTISGMTIDGTGGGLGSAILAEPGAGPSDPRNISVNDVTVEHQSAADGPGLLASQIAGDLEVRNSSFIENNSSGDGGSVVVDTIAGSTTFDTDYFQLNTGATGGAVWVARAQALTFESTEFDGNTATLTQGGAVFATDVSGAISVTDGCGFRGNSSHTDGGGLFLDADPGGFTIANSLVSGNVSGVRTVVPPVSGSGAGVAIEDANGVTAISGSTFSANTAPAGGGGGLYIATIGNAGSLSVAQSSFLDNNEFWGGGGIDVENVTPTSPVAVDIDGSTFSGNYSTKGGSAGSSILLQNITSEIIVTDSTLDEEVDLPGNEGALGLGGLVSTRPGSTIALIQSDTIDGPGALEIYDLQGGGIVHVDNSILQSAYAGDPAIGTSAVPAASIVLNYNLLTTASTAAFHSEAGNHFSVASLQLGALANNGGPTSTRLPTETSPAHNAGDPADAAPGGFDQRGTGFVRVVQRIDIGAVEIQTLTAPATLPTTGGTIDWRVPAGGVGALVLGLGLYLAARRRRRPHDNDQMRTQKPTG